MEDPTRYRRTDDWVEDNPFQFSPDAAGRRVQFEEGLRSFLASSITFEEWINALCDTLFSFIENVPQILFALSKPNPDVKVGETITASPVLTRGIGTNIHTIGVYGIKMVAGYGGVESTKSRPTLWNHPDNYREVPEEVLQKWEHKKTELSNEVKQEIINFSYRQMEVLIRIKHQLKSGATVDQLLELVIKTLQSGNPTVNKSSPRISGALLRILRKRYR